MTVSAAFPTIGAALMSVAEAAAPSARVVRGRDLSADPSDTVMIGVASVDDTPNWDTAGSFSQEFLTFGGPRQENGTVNGVIVAWDGGNDQATPTGSAFDLFALLAAAIRADPTLGIAETTGVTSVVAQIQGGDIHEQPDSGRAVSLSFVVSYQAFI